MSKFLYVYHGGSAPESEAEGQKVMKAWTDWLASLGKAVVDGGNPVGMSKTLHPGGRVTNDGGTNPTSGYSMVEARDIDDAVAKAKACPHLASGGTIEVAPVIEMG